jgi:hypothetical protein
MLRLMPVRVSIILSAAVAIAALFGAAAPSARADDVIRFGAPLPLTGPLAPEGIKQREGYDLWAEQANKAGGIAVGGKKYKVEIVYADYQSNTPRAVQTTEQMITQDNVNFLFGAFGSGAAKAASTVSEKYKVPTIAAAASSSQVYDQGYKYLFGTFTPNDTLTTPMTDIIKAKAPDVKKVAILARNDLFPLAIAQDGEIGQGQGARGRLFREIRDRDARPLRGAVADQIALAAMDLRHRLHQRPAFDPQADGGQANQGAGGHDARRPRLPRLHRAGRANRREHHQRVLVAPG